MKNPLETIRTDGGYVGIFRTMGFIGDSLSSGEFESTNEDGTRGFHDYYEYSWGQYIARKSGLTAYNFSRGGLQAKEFFEHYIKEVENPFVLEKRCQAYVIALGVNDMNHLEEGYYSCGFGSMDDVDMANPDNNKDSFVGWYVKIIQKLREFAPNCRIFVVTTAHESPENVTQRPLPPFLNELPKYFKFLYVIDLMKYGPTYDKEFGRHYSLGSHLSPVGYMFTADMISTYITYYIEEYPEDFAQVGFLYTGLHNANGKW